MLENLTISVEQARDDFQARLHQFCGELRICLHGCIEGYCESQRRYDNTGLYNTSNYFKGLIESSYRTIDLINRMETDFVKRYSKDVAFEALILSAFDKSKAENLI